MTTRDHRLQIDLAVARYLEALEQDDQDTLAALWREAALNHDLEAALHELHAGLVEEQEEGEGR